LLRREDECKCEKGSFIESRDPASRCGVEKTRSTILLDLTETILHWKQKGERNPEVGAQKNVRERSFSFHEVEQLLSSGWNVERKEVHVLGSARGEKKSTSEIGRNNGGNWFKRRPKVLEGKRAPRFKASGRASEVPRAQRRKGEREVRSLGGAEVVHRPLWISIGVPWGL